MFIERAALEGRHFYFGPAQRLAQLMRRELGAPG
jgi:hypothetical protein